MSKPKVDSSELLKTLLENDRLLQIVTENKLTKEQMIQALPVLIDMNNQDPEKDEVLTSFYVSRTGSIKRQEVLSPIGKNKSFINNIVTQSIAEISFDDSDFFKDDGRRGVVSAFAEIVAEDSKIKKGLYIYGGMGVGKTYTSKKFAKKIALTGKKVGIINLSTLSQKVKATFNHGGYEHIIELLKKVEYLFIDDIGAEPISGWFRDEFLFSVLNHRMDHKLITFFTSNYSMADLVKIESKTSGSKYWDTDKAKRLLERIKALSTEVEMSGKNHR